MTYLLYLFFFYFLKVCTTYDVCACDRAREGLGGLERFGSRSED